MNGEDKNNKRIVALAYFHRYGWVAVMFAFWLFLPHPYSMYVLSLSCIIFSLWSFMGYRRKWKHIFCSYQSSYHRKMTPDCVDWKMIKKSDIYGISLLFLVLGFAVFGVTIFK